jgi:hypothetical protein
LFQAVGTCRLVNMFIKKFALYVGLALSESLNVVYFAIFKMRIILSLFITLYSLLILVLCIRTYFVKVQWCANIPTADRINIVPDKTAAVSVFRDTSVRGRY